MWYTYFLKQAGMGGGILPPFPKTNNQIASPLQAAEIEAEAVTNSEMPPPKEKTPLQKKLEALHTNGYYPIPASKNNGINPASAIFDQYPANEDAGSTGQGYTPQNM